MKEHVDEFHLCLKDKGNFERFYAWSTMTALYFCLITPASECPHYA